MDEIFKAEQVLDQAFVMHTFARKPVEFVRGDGMRLFDSAGNVYLDFLSGIGVVSVGHSNPKLVKAITKQAQKLIHVSNYYYIEHRGELACRISRLLSNDTSTTWQSFFANSGAEANEGAIKLARLWGKKHLHGAYAIVSAERSFHGRTLATLAATAQDLKQDPFAPLPAGFGRVAFNDVDALCDALDTQYDGSKPAALMLECIQGESGVWPCTQQFLEAARAETKKRDQLLIIDEVQTGMFRTGSAFAFQGYGIEPDIVTMAKGIAGGVPMGAFAAKEKLAALLKPGMHGSTFGGSNIACAAADAVTQIMCEPGFAEHVIQMGIYLRKRLASLPFVSDVRGRGLMVGVTLEMPIASAIVDAALAHGLVLNAPAADILRFLPPLIVTEDDIDELIVKLPVCYEKACT